VYSRLPRQGETVFTGYDDLDDRDARARHPRRRPAGRRRRRADAEVILAESSLYAESGGQAADQGRIVGDGFELEVLDVQKPVKGLISHTVKVRSGEVGGRRCGDQRRRPDYRTRRAQAHSATHLVHAALRQTLGPRRTSRVVQQGRLHAPRLRWNQALSPETRSEIEEIANNACATTSR
jgi:alanyl-tRNA synthetase